MLPDRVSNSGPLTYESGALPIALCGPAISYIVKYFSQEARIQQDCTVFVLYPLSDKIYKCF